MFTNVKNTVVNAVKSDMGQQIISGIVTALVIVVVVSAAKAAANAGYEAIKNQLEQTEEEPIEE